MAANIKKSLMPWLLDLVSNYQPRTEVLPVFGVVIYTDAHPNLKKILRDNDYWVALDEISGPKWPVFSIRAEQGSYDLLTLLLMQACMVPVWKEPSENKKLLELFELEDTKRLPVLVVFTVLGDREVMRTVVALDDSATEAAFNRLREVMEIIAKAIEGISDENRSSGEGVLTAINYGLSNWGQSERVKKGYDLLKELRDWLPL